MLWDLLSLSSTERVCLSGKVTSVHSICCLKCILIVDYVLYFTIFHTYNFLPALFVNWPKKEIFHTLGI